MTLASQLDDQIATAEQAGLHPALIVLSYADHRTLSYEMGGPDVGYARPSPYYQFVAEYRNLPIIRPGIAYDRPPTVGVETV